MRRSFGLAIGGAWRPGVRSVTIESPWNGRPVGEVAVGGPEHLGAALDAAVRAAPVMAALPAWRRREILDGIAAGIAARLDEIAAVIRDEAGKPITYARGEATRATQTFRFASEEAGRLADESVDLGAVPTGEGRFGVVRRFPVGPVSAISPFNFPLNLVAHKVAPALAAGCPVVLKPASQTPMSALILAQICEAAGLPEGGLNVVPCDRKTADALTTDPRTKLLTFTGSPEVGWDMKARAGHKKVVLELGGNAAVIVHDDADVEAIVPRLCVGGYAYAGQVCISVQRLLAHEAVYDRLRDALVAHMADGLEVGDPTLPEVVCGPMIDAGNADRVQAWVAEAVGRGARVAFGGERERTLVQPLLVEGADRACDLYRREAFGPVVVLERYSTEDEAIARVNDSEYGLQAGVFTDRLSFVWRCFEELEVGGVIHNDYPTFRVDHMPYGGVKSSGFGREGLRYAMEDYTERRLLALKP